MFGVVAVVVIPLSAKVLRDRAVTRNRKRYVDVLTGPSRRGAPSSVTPTRQEPLEA